MSDVIMGDAMFWFLIVLSLLWTIAWLATLVNQAKNDKYVWLVFTALFNPVMILYWIIGGK